MKGLTADSVGLSLPPIADRSAFKPCVALDVPAGVAWLAAVGLALLDATAANAQHAMRIENGVLADGMASDQWLAMLRKRLGDSEYARVASVQRQLTFTRSGLGTPDPVPRGALGT